METKLNFRKTELISEETKKIVGESIIKDFLSLDPSEYWVYDQRRQELINAALDLGLVDVADKLIETT